MSDTPLIAEFCVRTGYLLRLLDTLQKIKTASAGILLLLVQLEEMIAFNFNVLSPKELEEMPRRLEAVYKMAKSQTGGKNLGNARRYKSDNEVEAIYIVSTVEGIMAECEQAGYFYLKGAILQNRSIEIESDATRVVRYLQSLGFDSSMAEALERAEKEYRDAVNAFDLKNCLGHLRSFLEHLHRETAKHLASGTPDVVKDRWGDATAYLRNKGLFTSQHEVFATSVFTLISDTSVHPLGADREYARLLRNVVIEYGVMFLSVLDKNKITIS